MIKSQGNTGKRTGDTLCSFRKSEKLSRAPWDSAAHRCIDMRSMLVQGNAQVRSVKIDLSHDWRGRVCACEFSKREAWAGRVAGSPRGMRGVDCAAARRSAYRGRKREGWSCDRWVPGRCQALDRTRVQLIMPSGATGYHTYSTAVRSESPSYLLHGAFLVYQLPQALGM